MKAILRRAPERARRRRTAARSRPATSSSTAPRARVTRRRRAGRADPREFDLLAALLAHPGVVLSRDRLLELVWGGEYRRRHPDRRRPRRPAARASSAGRSSIETVRGVGYKVARADALAALPASSPRSSAPSCVAVGVSLALGDRPDPGRGPRLDPGATSSAQADALASRRGRLPRRRRRRPAAAAGASAAAGPRRPAAAGAAAAGERRRLRRRGPAAVAADDAAAVLPEAAVAELARGRAGERHASRSTASSRSSRRGAVGDSVVLVTRPDVVAGDDFGRYLSGPADRERRSRPCSPPRSRRCSSRRLAAPLAPASPTASRRAGRGPAARAACRDERHRGARRRSPTPSTRWRRSSRRAREAERSVLLSVSHDLRTPLTAIERLRRGDRGRDARAGRGGGRGRPRGGAAGAAGRRPAGAGAAAPGGARGAHASRSTSAMVAARGGGAAARRRREAAGSSSRSRPRRGAGHRRPRPRPPGRSRT